MSGTPIVITWKAGNIHTTSRVRGGSGGGSQSCCLRRMYLVHPEEEGKSWTAIKDPDTGAVHRVVDRQGHFNMFRLSPDRLLWHTIYSETRRWSLGLVLSDNIVDQLFKDLE